MQGSLGDGRTGDREPRQGSLTERRTGPVRAFGLSWRFVMLAEALQSAVHDWCRQGSLTLGSLPALGLLPEFAMYCSEHADLEDELIVPGQELPPQLRALLDSERPGDARGNGRPKGLTLGLCDDYLRLLHREGHTWPITYESTYPTFAHPT